MTTALSSAAITGSLVSMNEYKVISLALHPYVLGIIPEQVLFAVILRARYHTKNSCQHASVFRIRRRTHHEVQVLNEQAEYFRIPRSFPLLLLRVGSDKLSKYVRN